MNAHTSIVAVPSDVARAHALIAEHIANLGRAALAVHGKPRSFCITNEIAAKIKRVRWFAAVLADGRQNGRFVCGMLGPNGDAPGIADLCRRAANFDAAQAAFDAARAAIHIPQGEK